MSGEGPDTAGGVDPTLDQAVRAASAVLAQAGVASPAVDAELLLAHALGQDVGDVRRGRILGTRLAPEDRTAYRELVARRRDRVPLQHLTGTAAFAGLDLAVGPGVFVPRPETEVLLDLALRALVGVEQPVVVDLCTGSGALAVALAVARPDAAVGAVELSAQAHRYASANVAALAPRVDLRLGAAQEAFGDLAGRVDVVVSNPPYIPADAVPVDVEVREHDPRMALYGGGEDGLRIPLEIAARAAVLLRPAGVLLMEHADVQGQSLPAALRGLGDWQDVTDHRDLAGLPRVARAVRGA